MPRIDKSFNLSENMKVKRIKKLFNSQKDVNPDKKWVNVCAWCPKKNYPDLKPWEEYTHGLCRKHYRKLSVKRDFAIALLIAELVKKTSLNIGNMDDKTRRYLRKLESSLKYRLEKITHVSAR